MPLAPTLGAAGTVDEVPIPLAPLPSVAVPDARQAVLGKLLFFDVRLAGDGLTSCSSCHQPEKGWADGIPLSAGYPGTLYFRNTPTVVNAAFGRYFFWDGRLPASDLPTLVRDHVSEAHFKQADGRLVIERLRQTATSDGRSNSGFLDSDVSVFTPFLDDESQQGKAPRTARNVPGASPTGLESSWRRDRSYRTPE